mmetsp:Transcript_10607/g.35082  ORF Transcript_10607/g.35082 Transcript_10607/m.35082 type:complete len:414 (-) Transcript_10607:591-1832(-)
MRSGYIPRPKSSGFAPRTSSPATRRDSWAPQGCSMLSSPFKVAAASSMVVIVARLKAWPGQAFFASSSSRRSGNASHNDLVSPKSLTSSAAVSMAQSRFASRIWTLSTSTKSVFSPSSGGNSTSRSVSFAARAALNAFSTSARTSCSAARDWPPLDTLTADIPDGKGDRPHAKKPTTACHHNKKIRRLDDIASVFRSEETTTGSGSAALSFFEEGSKTPLWTMAATSRDDDGVRRLSEVSRQKKTAVLRFNTKPQLGLEYLLGLGLWDGSPSELARWLSETPGLSKRRIGDFFGGTHPLSEPTFDLWLEQTLSGSVPPPKEVVSSGEKKKKLFVVAAKEPKVVVELSHRARRGPSDLAPKIPAPGGGPVHRPHRRPLRPSLEERRSMGLLGGRGLRAVLQRRDAQHGLALVGS